MYSALIALVLIFFGTTLGGLVLWKVFDIVRNSIKKNNGKYDEDRFDRLAKAFIQYKKDSERRFQHLEAIATGDEKSNTRSLKDTSHETIQIDAKDSNEEQTEQRNEKLPNMLNKQRS